MIFPINPFRGISYMLFLLSYAIIFLKHIKTMEFLHHPAPQMEKQELHFAKCRAMVWLAPSISVKDLRMLLWLIYYKQGTKKNRRPSSQSGYLHKPWISQQRCFLWPSWVFLSGQMWQVSLTHEEKSKRLLGKMMIVLVESWEAGEPSASDHEPCNQSHLGLNAGSTTSLG